MIMDVKTVFLKALDTETAKERQAYLDTACANDSGLREHVNRLLDAHEKATGFLDPEAFSFDALNQSSVTESPGTIIGRYELKEKLGEGGMAVVYRAEQKQPIHREVAIKVVKLGMDTAEVIARFGAERQTLAIMDHPNIAKVLDAGVTDAGKPYFVMELVQGISLTEYCDENRLNTQQRLELFVPICNAVHHAHQKGIIHRDLKPSNILVTQRDNEPVPVIIDFGIAKAIHQKFTDKTLFTLHNQLVGTPEYMSPEQADIGDMDVDTRTDIYSLGVVLYELLAGTSPFDATTLRRAALGEIQRIIREEEPLRPSTRISAMGNAAKDIADRRGTNVAELAKRLNRELEWIPLKAMRKDRVRRYRSAAEFADDIGNYLSDRPLLAGPESSLYRFGKMLHKHRIPVLAFSAVAAVLIVSLAVGIPLFMSMRATNNTLAQIRLREQVNRQLDLVRGVYAKGKCLEALEQIDALPEAMQALGIFRLTRAQFHIELGEFKPAEDELIQLIQTQPKSQIAGIAHSWLARIYLATDPGKAGEHKRLAESVLPKTAEDFYLRGMMAASADEALKWLSEALTLESTHYEARKARTFVHYSLRAYQDMEEDAGFLCGLRQKDYMGYALRGIARREIGQFDLALKDHAQAIALCSSGDERPRLYRRRRDTHMRMGLYKEALEDSQAATALDDQEISYPDLPALMALEQYDRIEAEFKRLVKLGEGPARNFKTGAEACAFELLRAGQPLALPPDIVSRSPFYFMAQAAELYARLAEKAKPLSIPGGLWQGDWSPGGQAIVYEQFTAFSWLPGTLEGITARLGTRSIEIMDLTSGRTEQIARSAYSPAFSPDGKYVAYSDNYTQEANIWVAPLAGGQARKLAQGLRPNWSGDSKRIFLRADPNSAAIYSIDIDQPDADPVLVMESQSGRHFACFTISPDESLMAFRESNHILALTFPEGKEVARWELPWPLQGWNMMLDWHPNGKTVILNSTSQYNQMGMCLLNVENSEMTHVLNVARPWCRTLWSPDGSQMLMSLYAHDDWWLWDIDPNVPLTETLAPALTTQDFLTQRLTKWNERIAVDPLYADNYVSRAVVLMALKDFDRAEQDLNHCVTLISESNDPAIHAIIFWSWPSASTEHTTEAQLWARCRTKLAERFPEAFEQSD